MSFVVFGSDPWAWCWCCTLHQVLSKLRQEEQGLPGELKLLTPTRDFTPPQFLTLLFTDLGVLTPSAVSDELIKLYY